MIGAFNTPISLLLLCEALYTSALPATALLSINQLLAGMEVMNAFLNPGTKTTLKKVQSKKFNELQEAIGCKEF